MSSPRDYLPTRLRDFLDGTPGGAGGREWGDYSRLLYIIGVILVLLFLIGAPLVFFVWGSFWTTEPGLGGTFTLEGYVNAFTNPSIQSTIADTVAIAVLGTIIALALGISTALITIKTELYGRKVVSFIIIGQYMLPGFVAAFGWDMYAHSSGPINQLLTALPFFAAGGEPFDVNTIVGISLVAGVYYSGLVYLLISSSVRSIPESLETAGKLSGASDWSLFRNVVFPLSLPAVAIAGVLIFTRLIQFFDIPVVLGLSEQIFVLSTQIYISVTRFPTNFRLASALGVLILLVSVIGLAIQLRITGPREQYETIGGKEDTGRVYQYDLGRFKHVTLAVIAVLVVVLYILPTFTVVMTSFQRAFAGYQFQLATWTVDNFSNLFFGTRAGEFRLALFNSLVISAVGALLGMVIASLVSFIIIKSDSPLGEFLNFLTLSTMAIPGIVIAISFFWIFITYQFLGIYGTIWIIMLALTAKFLVYGTRATNSSFRSLSDELEEAAQVSGAGLFTIFKEIFYPLIKPGFVAGYIILFIDYFKVLSIPLILQGSNNVTLPVMIWQSLGRRPTEAAAIGTIMVAIVLVIYGVVSIFTDYDIDSL